jgi:RNA polymerase sigma factor (sigma-70 family)
VSQDQLARLRHILKRMTALRIRNPEDVEDLVQETLLTMATKCPPAELRKGLLVWCMGILRRKIGNYYRKANRFISLKENASALTFLGPPSPEARFLYAELSALVGKAVAGLPSKERCVMDLHVNGVPAAQISALYQSESYQSILNRLHRGRSKVRKELSRYGYGRSDNGGPRKTRYHLRE